MKTVDTKLNYILETERLRLRQFTRDDTKFILELLNSPEWIEFIGDRNVKTETQATEYLQNGPMKRAGAAGSTPSATATGRSRA